MTKAMKKLLTSVVFLVIAISLAVTTTFAWFTMNATPEVGGIDLNVTSTDGLYISATEGFKDVDGTPTSTGTGADGTWTSNLKSLDILKAILIQKGMSEAEIEAEYAKDPVADTDVKRVAVLQKLLKGKVTMDAITTTDGITFKKKDNSTADSNSYLSFDLYFSSATEYTVALNDNGKTDATKALAGSKVKAIGTKAPTAVKAWKDLAGGTYDGKGDITEGTELLTRAANAVRIAFNDNIPAGTADPKLPKVTVWEPNSSEGFPKNNLANDYYDFISKTTTTVAATVAKNNDTAMIGLELMKLVSNNATVPVYQGKMTITIWLEGWDGDCFNSILSDAFTTELQFKGTSVVA